MSNLQPFADGKYDVGPMLSDEHWTGFHKHLLPMSNLQPFADGNHDVGPMLLGGHWTGFQQNIGPTSNLQPFTDGKHDVGPMLLGGHWTGFQQHIGPMSNFQPFADGNYDVRPTFLQVLCLWQVQILMVPLLSMMGFLLQYTVLSQCHLWLPLILFPSISPTYWQQLLVIIKRLYIF